MSFLDLPNGNGVLSDFGFLVPPLDLKKEAFLAQFLLS